MRLHCSAATDINPATQTHARGGAAYGSCWGWRAKFYLSWLYLFLNTYKIRLSAPAHTGTLRRFLLVLTRRRPGPGSALPARWSDWPSPPPRAPHRRP